MNKIKAHEPGHFCFLTPGSKTVGIVMESKICTNYSSKVPSCVRCRAIFEESKIYKLQFFSFTKAKFLSKALSSFCCYSIFLKELKKKTTKCDNNIDVD
jgi:hypothetical protein